MSRSNPTENLQNPAKRWMEWNGEKGCLEFYDKDISEKIQITDKMTFILLDQLSTIKGWHDDSGSAIYSNEVRNTSTDILSVKSFKGGEIANGLYKDIRDRVMNRGGRFTANLYVAIKMADQLQIASIQLTGAALNAWIDFQKDHRKEVYEKAVQIVGVEEGQKGSIKFKTPVFALNEVSEKTNAEAIELDKELQEYLKHKLIAKLPDAVDEPTNVVNPPIMADSVIGQTFYAEEVEDQLPF